MISPRRLALFLSALFLFGCISSGEVGRPFNASAAQKIEIGKTTEAEVITLLGEPLHTALSSSGTKIYVYQYSKIKGFATPVGASFSGVGDQISIAFDKKGVVSYLGKSKTGLGSKSGQSD